jgi:hypothetical protein
MTKAGFLLFYLLGMLPTYVLPYFGSNSYVSQAAIAAISESSIGLAGTILHVGALSVCVFAAWARAKVNGKGILLALPIVAAVFDLAPFINIIPMVPTVLHVVALVVGLAPDVEVDESRLPSGTFLALGVLSIIGVSFIAAGATFATGLGRNAERLAAVHASGKRSDLLSHSSGKESTSAKATADLNVADYSGWTVRQRGSVVELVKALSPAVGRALAGGASRTPVLGVLCQSGQLDVRLDTAGRTTGRAQTEVHTNIAGLPTEWDKSATYNIFPRNATAALRGFIATPLVSVQLAYEDIGPTTFSLDTTGLAQLINQLPATCR